jgi:hypothetical protein
MKAKIIYNLESVDDEMALKRALKSTEMALVLFELQNNLRKQCSWELEALEADSDKWDGLEVVFRKINELFEEHGINIDELIR